jgi:hypothetical protein
VLFFVASEGPGADDPHPPVCVRRSGVF